MNESNANKIFKELQKNSKGITLISLVVTIVILIILATVAISVILGRNSLLDNAEAGKKAYAKEEARERLQVVLSDAFVDKYTNRDEYDENDYLDWIFRWICKTKRTRSKYSREWNRIKWICIWIR